MGREDREGEDGNLFFICKSFLYISFFIYLFCLYFFIYISLWTQAPVGTLAEGLAVERHSHSSNSRA